MDAGKSHRMPKSSVERSSAIHNQFNPHETLISNGMPAGAMNVRE
jgi:hypothetical protein